MSKFCSDLEIKELIHQYRQHDCLWNIHSPNYKDKNLKQSAWVEVAKFFNKTPNEVKRKMQYLRAAYVHEKRRVEASRKSDSRTIHKPSLFYYNEMDFLDNIVIFRKMDDSQDDSNIYSESIESPQNFEMKEFVNTEDDYIQEPELNCKLEALNDSDCNLESSTPVSHTKTQLYTIARKKDISDAKPNKTLSSSTATKPQAKFVCYSFGKTIALQLQQLPLADAFRAMSEIQNIITKKTLEHIGSIENDNESCSQSEIEENYNEFNDEKYL